MADNALATTSPSRQLEPAVNSLANPVPQDLLEVRAEVQSSPRLQELFKQAHADKWSAATLTDRLITELMRDREEGTADPTEAATFLADEYTQFGPAGIQIINTATGRIAAIITEEDLYQPAPVARHGSETLATPLPRIRPDLESAIVTWFHDKGREAKVVEALAARGHQTALLRELGDPRLLVATRRGRKHIVESLSKIEPQALLESAGGSAGTFLRLFELTAPPDDGSEAGLLRISAEISAKSLMGVQDMLTTNLHHNRAATLRAAIVGGWLRYLARTVSQEVWIHEGGKGTDLDVSEVDTVPEGLWVVDPDFVRPLQRMNRKAIVFPVEGAKPIHIPLDGRKLGFLRVPGAFDAFSNELFDRWETIAYLNYDLWLDVSQARVYRLSGVDVVAQVL